MMPSFLPFFLFSSISSINQSYPPIAINWGFNKMVLFFVLLANLSLFVSLSFAAVQKTIEFKLSPEQVTRALELAGTISKSKFVRAGFVASSKHLAQFHRLCNYIIENGDSIDYGELLKLLAPIPGVHCLSYFQMLAYLKTKHPILETMLHSAMRKMILNPPASYPHCDLPFTDWDGYSLLIHEESFMISSTKKLSLKETSLPTLINIGGCTTELEYVCFNYIKFDHLSIAALNFVFMHNPKIACLQFEKSPLISYLDSLDLTPLINLESIRLSNSELPNEFLNSFLKKLPNPTKLVELDLNGCNFRGALGSLPIDLIGAFKSLTELNYSDNNLTRSDLAVISSLLVQNKSFYSLKLQIPSSSKRLNCPVKFISALQTAGHEIQSLTLIGFLYSNYAIRKLIQSLGNMKHLNEFSFSYEQCNYLVDQVFLKHLIQSVRQVSSLSLQTNIAIHDSVFEIISSKMPNLSKLKLKFTGRLYKCIPIDLICKIKTLSYLEIITNGPIKLEKRALESSPNSYCDTIDSIEAAVFSLSNATNLVTLSISVFIPAYFIDTNEYFFQIISKLPVLKRLIVKFPEEFAKYDPLVDNSTYSQEEGEFFPSLETISYDHSDLSVDRLRRFVEFTARMPSLKKVIIYSKPVSQSTVDFIYNFSAENGIDIVLRKQHTSSSSSF